MTSRSQNPVTSARENNHDHVLGFAFGRQRAALRAARRSRSRRRFAVRPCDRRSQAQSDVGRGRADLGWQRDLAGGHGGDLVGRVPGRLCDPAVGILSPPDRDVARPDPARRSIRVSVQDRTAALDLGLEFCGRIVDRNVHTRDDGRRAGGRIAVHQWRVFRRSDRLALAVRSALRHRPLPRLCAARRLLAGQEVRA